MRHVYIVSYDIVCDDRRVKVYKKLLGYGERIQYSVWRCDLSARARIELEAELSDQINHWEDQVLFIDLGPSKGRGRRCIHAVGKAFVVPPRGPKIF